MCAVCFLGFALEFGGRRLRTGGSFFSFPLRVFYDGRKRLMSLDARWNPQLYTFA